MKKRTPGLEPGIRGLQPLALAAWPRAQQSEYIQYIYKSFRISNSTQKMKLSKKLRYLVTAGLLSILSLAQDFDTHTTKKKQIKWAVEEFNRERPAAIFEIGGKKEDSIKGLEETVDKYKPKSDLLFGKIPAELDIQLYSLNRKEKRMTLRYDLQANLPKGFTLYGEADMDLEYDSGLTTWPRARLWVEKDF